MINYNDLVNAMVTSFGNIAQLLGMLAPADPVVPYIDSNPQNNSVMKARYQMQPGQVMVAWLETNFAQEEMGKWLHRVEIYVRAMRNQSDGDVVAAIMNGIPDPGDGQCWRNCPIMTGVLPTNVLSINRVTDEEGIDYSVILTETAETGDWPWP
jgi:hypothetical protein